LRCDSREEVLDILARNRRRLMRIARVEDEEAGDRVAVSVESPDFPDAPDGVAGAGRALVFTFHDRRVARMKSLPDRDSAFARLLT
jgi:hypothetical protein